jgi:hypothetical protein
MPDGTNWMIPMLSLASMRREERDRATQPLMLTMLPGGAAQKTAIAAVAVTQQARDGLRQERRVAEQTVQAVAEAAADPTAFDRTRLEQQPALRAVASDELVAQIKVIPTAVAQQVADQTVAAVTEAVTDPPGFNRQSLEQKPALRAIATEDLVSRIKGIPSVDKRVADQAVDALKAAIALPVGQKLSKADLPAKFPELAAHLTTKQKGEISQ